MLTRKEAMEAVERFDKYDGYVACTNCVPLKDAHYLIGLQRAEIEKLQAMVSAELDTIHDLGDDYERVLEEEQEFVKKAKAEAIEEFRHKSESTLIKLYEKYRRIANRPNSAWLKIFTKEENEMFYQGRAKAIWECIDANRNIIKEMVGDQNV